MGMGLFRNLKICTLDVDASNKDIVYEAKKQMCTYRYTTNRSTMGLHVLTMYNQVANLFVAFRARGWSRIFGMCNRGTGFVIPFALGWWWWNLAGWGTSIQPFFELIKFKLGCFILITIIVLDVIPTGTAIRRRWCSGHAFTHVFVNDFLRGRDTSFQID